MDGGRAADKRRMRDGCAAARRASAAPLSRIRSLSAAPPPVRHKAEISLISALRRLDNGRAADRRRSRGGCATDARPRRCGSVVVVSLSRRRRVVVLSSSRRCHVVVASPACRRPPVVVALFLCRQLPKSMVSAFCLVTNTYV